MFRERTATAVRGCSRRVQKSNALYPPTSCSNHRQVPYVNCTAIGGKALVAPRVTTAASRRARAPTVQRCLLTTSGSPRVRPFQSKMLPWPAPSALSKLGAFRWAPRNGTFHQNSLCYPVLKVTTRYAGQRLLVLGHQALLTIGVGHKPHARYHEVRRHPALRALAVFTLQEDGCKSKRDKRVHRAREG